MYQDRFLDRAIKDRDLLTDEKPVPDHQITELPLKVCKLRQSLFLMH